MLYIHQQKFYIPAAYRGWFAKMHKLLFLGIGVGNDVCLGTELPIAIPTVNMSHSHDLPDIHYIVYCAKKFGILLGYFTKYLEPSDVFDVFNRAVRKN
jgi:hypothetical protein